MNAMKQWALLAAGLAAATLLAVPALAQPKPLVLKPNAPERYIVVSGDTLWSIEERYTDSPWRWTELWNMNKATTPNPHRIYPGDVLVIDRARGQLAVAADAVAVAPLGTKSFTATGGTGAGFLWTFTTNNSGGSVVAGWASVFTPWRLATSASRRPSLGLPSSS